MRHALFAFDIESTGLYPWWHEPTEIGAVVLDVGTGMPTSNTFQIKVNPVNLDRAEPIALRIGQYDQSLWDAEAVSMKDGLSLFAEWLVEISQGGLYKPQALGHNVKGFDMAMVEQAFNTHGVAFSWDYRPIDTICEFARMSRLFDGEMAYKLSADAMCKYCRVVNTNPHRALPDAIAEGMCYAIFAKALDIMLEYGKDRFSRDLMICESHYRLGWPCFTMENYIPLADRG